MIPSSTTYCLVVEFVVVARGSAKEMRCLKKQRGGVVCIGFGPVGSHANVKPYVRKAVQHAKSL